MIIRYNEQKGCWEEHKEPYTTIAVQTEEDFNEIKAAIEKQNPMKPTGKYKDVNCPVCGKYLGQLKYETYCCRCGQKLDWSER